MGTCVECSSPTSRQCRCLGAWYCSPQCQTLAWPAHRSSCPATEVAALPGKGRALTASRTIARGATILREAAIMLVDCGQGRRPAQAITDQYAAFTPEQRVAFDSLNGGGGDRLAGIFHRNCVQVGLKEGRQGVYPRFAMVNHSCAGNAILNFTPDDALQLVAARRIGKGEEVTVNYLDAYIYRGELAFLREQRQAALKSRWGFTCTCEVCALTGSMLHTNESIKRTMKAYCLKSKEFQKRLQETAEEIARNMEHILALEEAILHLMEKMEREMVREMPECLLRCYLFGKLLQVVGARVEQEPGVFLRRGRALAAALGPSHAACFATFERAVDAQVARQTAALVRVRVKEAVPAYWVVLQGGRGVQ